MCIDGTLRGNSVVGPAYVIENNTSDVIAEVGDSYIPYAGITALQVRLPQTVGERLSYAQALLDLGEYSQINAGTSLAPSGCDVPAVPLTSATEETTGEGVKRVGNPKR